MEMKVKNDPVVAIAGVTGAVGAEFIATMDKRQFPVGRLKALASARSAGKTLGFRGETITVEEMTEASTSRCSLPAAASPGSMRRSPRRPAPSSSTTHPLSEWTRRCPW
jgi:aspartate-semialdehyde dehydrogenase